jgi:serine/threonine-protein kinase
MQAFEKTQVFGPYRLKAKIADGGMAEVFLATSTRPEFHGQFLAIKKLLPNLNANKAFVDLLIHEAKIGVLLNHPGIASVFDLGSYKSEFFLAIEYVHGKSMDRIFEKIKNLEATKPALEISTFIILECLRALAFAHQLKDSKGRDLSIIHRDISPGNILIGYRGEVKLVDFGIATAESRLQQSFTQTPLGKLAYMAPEQAVNDPVVKASDIYSLGVVYYQLLTGQLPFQADNASALLKKVIDGRVTDIRMVGPSISQPLQDIVTRCLEKSSRKRFQSAPELFQALVDHFKSDLGVDFTARATRDYYRKKLSEYMRSVYNDELVEELQIIQSALADETVPEELKETKPQNVSEHLEADLDATQVLPDHTHETTRTFALSSDERQNLFDNLPPRQSFSENTEDSAYSQPSIKPGFKLETIPEYDLATDDSSLRRISVKDRLEKSALSRDHQETLKQQMPEMEITTQHELESFEQSTFSGKFPQAFEQPTSANSSVVPISEVDRTTEPREQKSKPGARISATQRSANNKTQSSFNWRAALASFGIAMGITVILGIAAYQAPKIWAWLSERSAPLIPTQNIKLVLSGETSLEILKAIQLQLNSPAGLQQIEKLFNAEHSRYTNRTEPALQLRLSEPEVFLRGLSAQDNPLELMRSQSVFKFLEVVDRSRPGEQEAIVHLYVYPFNPRAADNMAFPQEFPGQRPRQMGIAYLAGHESQSVSNLLNIAREIAFVYGAKETRDSATRLPLNPEGLANPLKQPLYPQDHAELMAYDRAVSPLLKEAVSDFTRVKIGPHTAHQLGWIDQSELKNLTQR